MNALETFISEHKLSELECMNVLQQTGVVSDNCMLAKDVADSDTPAAIAELEELIVLLKSEGKT